MSGRAPRAFRIEHDVERALLVIRHEAAAQDGGGGGLTERRREQIAFAVGTHVGLEILDPREAADIDAGRRFAARICSRRRLPVR